MEPDFPTTTKLHPFPLKATPFASDGYTIPGKGCSPFLSPFLAPFMPEV